MALYIALMSVSTACIAWVMMWVTDRFYELAETGGLLGVLGLIAIFLRVTIFVMQVAVLLACLGVIIVIVKTTFDDFKAASSGLDTDTEETLTFKGYLLKLLTPIVMVVASLLLPLFTMWLDFNERGLGLIQIGYGLLQYLLVYGSILITIIWVVVLPFFLRNRHVT
jgi:hypothetical protein